jgi:predicted HTH transcriptional regulator
LIPKKLSDWNYIVIEDLVNKNYLETNEFEFKPAIRGKDPKLNDRIMETSCAFANTNGGFIVFGIKDSGNTLKDRIMGIEFSDDTAKEFGDKIKLINPPVDFEFSNPLINIPNKPTKLLVIHIPKSNRRPHMKTDIGKYYYRTNNGNEIMSYELTKDLFLQFEEKQKKLHLFYLEILSTYFIAKNLLEDALKNLALFDNHNGTSNGVKTMSALVFDPYTFNNLMPEIYTIIQEDPDLINSIFLLKLRLNTINNQLKKSNNEIIKEFNSDKVILHNHACKENMNTIIPLCTNIISKLEMKWGFKNPFPDDLKIF